MRAGPNERALEGGWERAISMHRTTWSYVAEVRRPGRGVPAAAAVRVWLSWDTPHASYYTVLYGSQDEVPSSWDWGLQCTMSRHSAWWASNVVKNWLDLRFSAMYPDVVSTRVRAHPPTLTLVRACLSGRAASPSPHRRRLRRRRCPVPLLQEELEAEIRQTTAAAEAAAFALEDGTAAGYERSRRYLQAFAVGTAEVAQRKWWGLAERLMARFSNGCGYGYVPHGHAPRTRATRGRVFFALRAVLLLLQRWRTAL